MLFLKPDEIDQIKRDKKTFYDKNQIDGDGLPIRLKPREPKIPKNIYDPDYGESEDFNDSEN